MEALLTKLNPPQREAVEQISGPLLVVAGAGSGKTRVITTRIMYLLEQHDVSPYQILAMTFTNKAAMEMKTRVAQLVGRSMRDLTVTTFHSFCARFLRREIEAIGRDSNFAIYDTSDQTATLKRVLRDAGLSEKNFPATKFRNRISYYKNLEEGARPDNDLERDIFDAYHRALEEQNALDFDDLLLYTVRILKENEAVRSRYKQRFQYVMVDEYQDTNRIQAQLINLLLNEDHNICVVGDEDQSIYGWRGADIRNILDFEIHYPEARVIKLEQNYRSTQNILDYANHAIAANELRKPKKLWTAADKGAPIMIKDEWTGANEAEYIIQMMKRLSKEDNVDFGSFAVLFRSNFLSRSIEEMCRRYKIPYQLIGGLKFYDRKEIKDLLAFMRIVVNPRDWTSFVRAIGVPSRGVGAKSLDILYRRFNEGRTLPEVLEEGVAQKLVKGRGFSGLKEFHALYTKLRQDIDDILPHEWLENLIEALDYRQYLEKLDDATVENRVANVDELIAAMRELEAQGVRTLAQFMDFSALVSDQDEIEDSQPKVSLMTVHAAKGLEFDTVFVMGLEDGIFPNQRSINDNPNAIEEERRLFYVAVTRARKRLYLSYARRRQTFGTTTANPKSRFLLAPGADTEAAEVAMAEDTQEDTFLRPSSASSKKKSKLAALSEQVAAMQEQLKKQRDVDVDFGSVAEPKTKKTNAFRPGDTVRHKTFGVGTVSMVRGSGDQLTVSVYFPGKGKKTLVAKVAKLEKVI